MTAAVSRSEATAARPLTAFVRLPLPPKAFAGFVVAALAVLLIAYFSSRAQGLSNITAERVSHTMAVLEQVEALISSLKDAETGQRGFLLTNTESYLAPYMAAKGALPGEIRQLRALTSDNPAQLQRIDAVEQLTIEKMDELAQTITMRRSGDAAGAMAVMVSDRGRAAMVRTRAVVDEMRNEERGLLARRQREAQDAADFAAWVSWGGSALLLALIAAGAVMATRDHRSRENSAWQRAGQLGLSERLQGEQRLEVLGEGALAYLADYLAAPVGAIYVAEADGRYRRVASHATAPASAGPLEPAEFLRPGDGLLGQAAKQNRALRIEQVPADYFGVVSATGQGAARELLVAPASADGVVQAVLELGFFRALRPEDLELLERVSEQLGVAVRSAKDRSRLEALLEETQRQAEELQAQQEELRVSNEELEEQGHALKESQARLEGQHAELEQNNAQLEEQAQALESQRDALARAQAVLSDKAVELERSNQYKSEFLANMSHELRTPLNSTLILAKLLADNKAGNLSDEQVKFAQTISSAGNDLLLLINDILDLSKIEAGKVELELGEVVISRAIDSLVQTLSPLAQPKGLALSATLAPGLPERFETDAQRLGQILKNLLSNALKFTERGEVGLSVSVNAAGGLDFAVRDSGIGIPAEQQQIIFEAFRQADGSTHRKYGGTGLGLSISRDLARLLGGDLTVQSAPGQGSVFTLSLPLQHAAPVAATRPAIAPARPAPSPPAPAGTPAAAHSPGEVDDDRRHLTPGTRLILVIEDDLAFAAILRDLAHELGFECVVTHTAGEGLAAASSYRPSAILLDMNLPDHSGLGVLDQLKRNPQTRHIPVHVASVADYSHEALERGAVGYALKPVAREQLVDAIRRLETKISQGVRRVLVVEDDERQRESIQQLLGTGEVEIVGVETAGDALAQLQATTFDCMVMDLSLPDLSGYELLEKMAEQEQVAFPPVIVYTGRSLTRDEEQTLRRFSKSIIIKDARSPERLLDEVTLFLHQVEAQLPADRQRMLKAARDRDATLEGRRILVVEDDVRNIFALTSVLEPKGVKVQIARNGREALTALAKSRTPDGRASSIDLVLMDIMMPEMDGFTAMREIRKLPEWSRLPIIALTAKAMKDDQENCLAAGANDYIAKPLDVDKLLSLVRVWMPK